MLSPAGCMWLCLCGERLWSSLYLVIKESLWQKPNIRRDELWTKELWQFQVMWFLCPFFAKWKINTFSGLYIFRVSTVLPPWWREGRRDCGLEWGGGGGVACSSVITVPSHFPTHWWIFQSWCDCPSWQRWCFFFFFFPHLFFSDTPSATTTPPSHTHTCSQPTQISLVPLNSCK